MLLVVLDRRVDLLLLLRRWKVMKMTGRRRQLWMRSVRISANGIGLMRQRSAMLFIDAPDRRFSTAVTAERRRRSQRSTWPKFDRPVSGRVNLSLIAVESVLVQLTVLMLWVVVINGSGRGDVVEVAVGTAGTPTSRSSFPVAMSTAASGVSATIDVRISGRDTTAGGGENAPPQSAHLVNHQSQ